MTFDPGSVGFVAVLARATLLLGAAVTLAWSLRRGAAGTRHLLWTATFATLLLLLPAMVLLPRWDLPLLPVAANADSSLAADTSRAVDSVTTPARELAGAAVREPGAALGSAPGGLAPAAGIASPRALPVRGWLMTVWICGSVAALLSLVVGGYRLRRLVAGAEPVTAQAWRQELARLRLALGVRQSVRLLRGSEVHTPMTGGWRRPVILLPTAALEWSAQRRRVVLAHELIHIRRRDAPRQLLGHLALSLYWFHPLSWIAARLAAATREQACDEAVVALGTRPSDYAKHLLELAESMGPVPAIVTLPIIQPSNLERRVMAILEPHPSRHSSRATALVILLIVLLGVSVAVARAVPASPRQASPQARSVRPAGPTPGSPEPALRTESAVGPSYRQAQPAAAGIPLNSAAHTCRMESLHGNFSGTLSYSGEDSEPRRYEVAGWHDGDRIIQRHLDGVRLCLRVHGEVVMADNGLQVRAAGRDSWVVLESESDALQRLEITESSNGIEHEWSIDGTQQPFDADARAWRDGMFTVLNGMLEISDLHGQVSALRGKISSARGHVSSLRGQISSYRGQISSYRGQMSSYRGQVSSYRGEISSYRGRVSSYQGQISSHRGKISSLTSALNATEDADTRAGLQREISALQERIGVVEAEIDGYDLDARVAEVESKIAAYDLEGKLAAVQAEIDAFDLDDKVRQVQEQIEAFELDGKVREIQEQIEALHVDERVRQIEARIEPQLQRLRELIARL